ncbi:SpoIIE family protein phosphatase [Butyrivibrio proteoclasticus]|uniref:SpoIIE family protein phosphatase n=1 Tax=Butyrivibrio proteoclasticus TaxID=43305 RepID=UPI000685E2F5|nr:SpoIIE family protein phosphatase [Butyrivibrio proteoclasticus]
MIIMIIKMILLVMLYLFFTAMVWLWTRKYGLNRLHKLAIGIIYGISAILATHYGVSFGDMIINVRDLGPLIAGLFFSPYAGVIAGLIGGVERYIAGTYFGVGTYTRVACSVSTCLAGFVALLMNKKVFRGKKPSPVYAFFMGAVMEVFHMYVVFVTHRSDMRMAFTVVKTCSVPMIIFTGIGLACCSIMLQCFTGEWKNPFVKRSEESISVSQKFQRWLFLVTSIVVVFSFIFSFTLQNQSAYQNSCLSLEKSAEHLKQRYLLGDTNIPDQSNVEFDFFTEDGRIIQGRHKGVRIPEDKVKLAKSYEGKTFEGRMYDDNYLIRVDRADKDVFLVVYMVDEEVYWYRNAMAYETALSDILLFTVIYVLIAFLVNQIVVINIQLVNKSLNKITNGDLNEVVQVRSSSEFASLSDDINQTVLVLKSYIDAAEKRIEQELIFAKTIQENALPKTFVFPERDEFELYASMKPAKEIGGDFYDFFFIDMSRMALVIADVSGKGIPAALFMMRSKTAIRSLAESGLEPAEIIYKANNALCEGNDAEMFVTVWIGIIDLCTGVMKCANAGHEYPAIMRAGGDYELLKDKHSLALAAMENLKAKEYEITLNPGDKLFVYTDGVPEAINENVEQYGTDRMIEVLNVVKNDSIQDTLAGVSASVNAFKGDADQFDDITMLGFEFKKNMRTWDQ